MKSDKSIYEIYLNPYFFCLLIPLKILKIKIKFPLNNQFQQFGFKHRKLKYHRSLRQGRHIPRNKWQVYSIFSWTVSAGGRKYTEMSKKSWQKIHCFSLFFKALQSFVPVFFLSLRLLESQTGS